MNNTFEMDQTQKEICRHLKSTEELLAEVSSLLSGRECGASITPLSDLGLPHNVTRMRGGFYTGAHYQWDSDVPFVPVDATVNVCGVAVYKIPDREYTAKEFERRIERAVTVLGDNSSLIWNINSGNHFATIARSNGAGWLPLGQYLVLHASTAEFKKQFNGLYPSASNWFSEKVQTYVGRNNRYLRYLAGSAAEKFFDTAKMLIDYQRIRQATIAELIVGEEVEQVISVPHYGMPSSSSVAIGCQWMTPDSPRYLLLTRPMAPLYLIKALPGGANEIDVDGQRHFLTPHGLGVRSAIPLSIEYKPDHLRVNGTDYSSEQTIESETFTEFRDLVEGETVDRILSAFPGRVEDVLIPLSSSYRRKEAR